MKKRKIIALVFACGLVASLSFGLNTKQKNQPIPAMAADGGEWKWESGQHNYYVNDVLIATTTVTSAVYEVMQNYLSVTCSVTQVGNDPYDGPNPKTFEYTSVVLQSAGNQAGQPWEFSQAFCVEDQTLESDISIAANKLEEITYRTGWNFEDNNFVYYDRDCWPTKLRANTVSYRSNLSEVTINFNRYWESDQDYENPIDNDLDLVLESATLAADGDVFYVRTDTEYNQSIYSEDPELTELELEVDSGYTEVIYVPWWECEDDFPILRYDISEDGVVPTITTMDYYATDRIAYLPYSMVYQDAVMGHELNDELEFQVASTEPEITESGSFSGTMTGICPEISDQSYVTFNFENNIVDVDYYESPEEGWYFNKHDFTFVYYENSTKQETTLEAAFYHLYGDVRNNAVLTYSSTGDDGQFTLLDATYTDPNSNGTNYYIITGEYDGETIVVYVDSLEEDFVYRWEFDRQEGFQYWYEPNNIIPATITEVYIYNFGEDYPYNEADVTMEAYATVQGDQPGESTQELVSTKYIAIYAPTVGQSSITGDYDGETVFVNYSVTPTTINIGPEEYAYMPNINELCYETSEGDRLGVEIIKAVYSSYNQDTTVEIEFQFIDVNGRVVNKDGEVPPSQDDLPSYTFELTSATIDSSPDFNSGMPGYISGTISSLSSNINGTQVTLRTMNLTESMPEPYWVFEQGYLRYIDPANPDVQSSMTDCVFYEDSEVFVLTYSITNPATGGSEMAEIILSEGKIVEPIPYEYDAQNPALIEGVCSEIDGMVDPISLYVPVPIRFEQDTVLTEGWNYVDNTLLWVDEQGATWEPSIESCTINVQTLVATFECKILIEGESIEKGFVLNNASFIESLDQDSPRYIVTGYNSDVAGTDPISLYVNDLYTEGETQPEKEAYWAYDGQVFELYWIDEENMQYSQLKEAYYYERTNEVTFVYDIYQIIVNEDDNTEETSLVGQKTAHMTNVTYEEVTGTAANEAFIYVSGSCIECEEATTLRVEKSKFITATYDEDPGTITPDQQIDIKDLLPVEASVEEERMEESIVAISSETAHEIIQTVNAAHKEIEEQKAAGTITEQEYQEKKEIIETVTEASVVVGAGQTLATNEGEKVNKALPDNSGVQNMSDAFEYFYQKQMDDLLGTNKAERSIIRGISRAPGESQGIDLDVSKEVYAKAIEFVDVSVDYMKTAALQIRKCMTAETTQKLSYEVNRYISTVKISSFRDYNEAEANEDFVQAIYKAIMLHLQQQVIEALKKDHKPSNNPEKEMLYNEQLEACQDYETFEEIVLEVLRLKYVALTEEDIAIDEFRPIYDKIFRSWALDDPSINPTNITLEQLTQATIETTKSNASKFTYRTDMTKEESTALIIIGATLGVGVATAMIVPGILNKKKRGRARAR